MKKIIFCTALSLALMGCQSLPMAANDSSATTKASAQDSKQSSSSEPFASTYTVPSSAAYVIRNANVLDGTGQQLDQTDVLFRDGKIAEIGQNLLVDDMVMSIDGTGMWVTPGIIDVHSHMGVYPSLAISVPCLMVMKSVAPSTAGVWAEHSIWPQDPNFEKAVAGGVTTAQILPGSANLFGGRGVTVKLVPTITMMGMKFPDAPHSLKMACGENPKRNYGDKGGPKTRMGNMAGYRTK